MALVSIIFLVTIVMSEGNAAFTEYQLKEKLLHNYLNTVRPVKNVSDVVHVTMDVAVRAIVDVDERRQIMTSSIWVRMYWTDEYLVWNESASGGIDSINFLPNSIWVPDVVLYNSIDEKRRGTLRNTMRTKVIVSSSGACKWLCPLVVKSQCRIHVKYYPFDNQTCKFQFGLWTNDASRVNFSYVRNYGDKSTFLRNGEWFLGDIPASKKVQHFSCCKDKSFTSIIYYIQIKRRTLFYIFSYLFPGFLVTMVALIAFLLPPESQERMYFGISGLLSITFLLVLVSKQIPPVSSELPLIDVFFTVTVMTATLSVIFSALSIKLYFTPSLSMSYIAKGFSYATSNNNLAKFVGLDGRKRQLTKLDSNLPMQEVETEELARLEKERHWEASLKEVETNFANQVQYAVDHISRKEEVKKLTYQWHVIVKAMDRIFFGITFGTFVIAVIVMFGNKFTTA